MSDSIIHKTKITNSLGTFEFEGSREFVETQIEKIVSMAKTHSYEPKESSTETNHSQNQSVKKTLTTKPGTEKPRMLPNLIIDGSKIKEIKEYYESKNPETHIEIFAVLTCWLKNNTTTTEVSIDEMHTLYKILQIRPPKVLIQVFRDGKSKKGYFDGGSSRGHYYITTYGETLVEHDLPRKKITK